MAQRPPDITWLILPMHLFKPPCCQNNNVAILAGKGLTIECSDKIIIYQSTIRPSESTNHFSENDIMRYMCKLGRLDMNMASSRTQNQTVIHASVTDQTLQCTLHCLGISQSSFKRLQLVQNAGARLLTGSRYRGSALPQFWLLFTGSPYILELILR